MATSVNGRRAGLGAAAWLVVLAGADAASAQVVERNLPPAPPRPAPSIVAPNALPAEQDATPIGPALRAIALIGPDDPVRPGLSDGIDAAPGVRLRPDRLRGLLGGFLGRPLSRRLIAEIEAKIARAYRSADYPFVSISTPEQEITSGALQIRVIEFTAGKLSAVGGTRTPEAYLTSRVRVAPGEPISSARLTEDLNWLNRYPFRRVEAVFTPGSTLGRADLVLNATETKPWLVYGGYANAGSASTGWDRYFAGAQVGGLLGRDSVVSYQATLSNDALSQSHPRYLSHAVRLVLPANARAEVEATADWVQSNQSADPFEVRQTTLEGALGYRFALSNLSRRLSGWGDARFGVEARRQEGRTFFAGVDVYDAEVEVYQLYLGYQRSEEDGYGRSDLDILAHLSPGGVDEANSRERAQLYSQGRVKGARYAYFGASLNRTTRLRAGFSWTAMIVGQYSAVPLPRTEQTGLGAPSLVRGYSLDDGAFDQSILIRNELRAPALRLLPARVADQLSPYVFLDAGTGRDQFFKVKVDAASAGVGADWQLASRFSVSLDAAWALRDAVYTRSGDWRLETRLSASF